ncbi:MAG TPA: hypothetical protein VER76_00960, partial [Pyrinomonadaceae bacterium]|nr:hypothetical protein [Pyrinomonadaceae bacterium]
MTATQPAAVFAAAFHAEKFVPAKFSHHCVMFRLTLSRMQAKGKLKRIACLKSANCGNMLRPVQAAGERS